LARNADRKRAESFAGRAHPRIFLNKEKFIEKELMSKIENTRKP
jgi:hypothetical protein